MPQEQIRLIEFFNQAQLITNQEVVKVLAIKAKFVEQMPFHPLTREGYGTIKILGATREYIVIRSDNGLLTKISYSDYRLYLIDSFRLEDQSIDEANRSASIILKQIPQLFET